VLFLTHIFSIFFDQFFSRASDKSKKEVVFEGCLKKVRKKEVEFVEKKSVFFEHPKVLTFSQQIRPLSRGYF